LKKFDKKIPGFSYFFNPKKMLHLKKDQSDLLELASSFLLLADKATKSKKDARRYFSRLVKQKVLIRQDFCCNLCLKPLDNADFHHIDGDRSNNNIWNCEALCPNCHAKKTRKK